MTTVALMVECKSGSTHGTYPARSVSAGHRLRDTMMETQRLQARFTDFELPSSMEPRDATVAIPVSNGTQQRYFFMNLKTRKGLTVDYPGRGGLTTRGARAYLHHLCSFTMRKEDRLFPRARTVFRRYHNGISFIELLYKVLKPHGMTYIGGQRYLVSLWSASIYFVIDLNKRTIEIQMLSKDRNEVFSTYQYFDADGGETYFATQLGDDELHKHVQEDIHFDVPIEIKKYNWATDTVERIWKGPFDTDTHYIALNKDKTYLGLVNFGDFFDEQKNLLPSKILILDMKTGKDWRIDNTGWSPSAHIDWDPVEPDICYLSCHRGVITPVDSRLKFFFQKVYKWNIFGPASVHKYRITSKGPEKMGVFTHPEIFRLTIHKVFVHRSRRLLACTGFPNYVCLADAETLEFIRKIEVTESCGSESVVGSLFPSPDGEKIYLITTGSFQIIDVETGKIDLVYGLGRIFDPFNHMTSVSDTAW